jgi:hypothetical protein
MQDDLLRAYELLDLSPGAPLDEVKAAYRDLAKVWHPDRYQNEGERLRRKVEEKLKAVTEAYRKVMAASEGEPMRDPLLMDFGELWGYIDESGETVIHPQFEVARPFVDGLAAVRTVGKWGFIDATGEFRINPLYDDCGDFSEGLAAVQWHGKWGYIDRTGTFVVTPRYQEAGPFERGYATVRLGARAGRVDRYGHASFDPSTSVRHIHA